MRKVPEMCTNLPMQKRHLSNQDTLQTVPNCPRGVQNREVPLYNKTCCYRHTEQCRSIQSMCGICQWRSVNHPYNNTQTTITFSSTHTHTFCLHNMRVHLGACTCTHTFTCTHVCVAHVWGPQYNNCHHISSNCTHSHLLVSSPQFMQVLCTLLAQLARPPRATNLVCLLEQVVRLGKELFQTLPHSCGGHTLHLIEWSSRRERPPYPFRP